MSIITPPSSDQLLLPKEMLMNLRNDETFQKIEDEISINNGLMKDAWIVYKGQKWFPVIVNDRTTGVSGFEVNLSGKWGANSEVGRKKFPLADFLMGISSGIFPAKAALRCKRLDDAQRNGRNIDEIQFTPRLKELISRIRESEMMTRAPMTDVSLIQTAVSISGLDSLDVNEINRIADDSTGSMSTVGESADLQGSDLQGYEHDQEMRSTVELYAEFIARKYYVSQGFDVRKLGKPFDFLCEKDGKVIHVEVKGSRTKLDSVILTINEVYDAENTEWQSDLFIVDQIVVERKGDVLVAGGGVARIMEKWVPAKEMLTPSQFRYRLPDHSKWKVLK